MYLKNGADGICAGFSHLAWLKYLNTLCKWYHSPQTSLLAGLIFKS